MNDEHLDKRFSVNSTPLNNAANTIDKNINTVGSLPSFSVVDGKTMRRSVVWDLSWVFTHSCCGLHVHTHSLSAGQKRACYWPVIIFSHLQICINRHRAHLVERLRLFKRNYVVTHLLCRNGPCPELLTMQFKYNYFRMQFVFCMFCIYTLCIKYPGKLIFIC